MSKCLSLFIVFIFALVLYGCSSSDNCERQFGGGPIPTPTVTPTTPEPPEPPPPTRPEPRPGIVNDFLNEGIALLLDPCQAQIAPDGKLYISDSGNQRIRVLDMSTKAMSGTIDTFAGSYRTGTSDGVGTDALFKSPGEILITPDGSTMYVADYGGPTIRKIDIATQTVTTFAGTAGVKGTNNPTTFNPIPNDGVGAAAKFIAPFAMTFNHDYTAIYIADSDWIRKLDIDPASPTYKMVTSIGGFITPVYGVAYSYDQGTGKEYLYMALTFDNTIRRFDLSQNWITRPSATPDQGQYINTNYYTLFAGGTFSGNLSTSNPAGNIDGSLQVVRFNMPCGMAISKDNNYLYVCDYSNNTIRKIDIAAGQVSTLAGPGPSSANPGEAGYADGPSADARFINPYSLGISRDANSTTLYVGDSGNNRIRTVDTLSGETTTMAGSRGGFNDGLNIASKLYFEGAMLGMRVSKYNAATIYYADVANIAKLDMSTLTITPLAVTSELGPAAQDNTGYNQWYRGLGHNIILTDDEQTIYTADSTSNCIRRINVATGASTILAGAPRILGLNAGVIAWADGIGEAALFHCPSCLVLSPDEQTIYVSDAINNRIRAIDIASRAVTTIAGSGEIGNGLGTLLPQWPNANSTSMYLDDPIGTNAKFNLPTGLAVSPDGNTLYVADSYNNRIRTVDIAPGQTNYAVGTLVGSTLTGTPNAGQCIDGDFSTTTLAEPRALEMSPDGTKLYTTDFTQSSIRVIDLENHTVTTISGGTGIGYYNGSLADSLYTDPSALTWDPVNQILYVLDRGNITIREIVMPLP